jgi:hypothetical protein
MHTFSKDFLSSANSLIDGIANFRVNRRATDQFFSNIEQTKILMRVKDRLSHSQVLI